MNKTWCRFWLAPPHPWWHYLPPERRRKRDKLRLLIRRLRCWMLQRRQLICLALASYLLICALPMLFGLPLLVVIASLPLFLVPPVGLLIYWLVWKEFHA